MDNDKRKQLESERKRLKAENEQLIKDKNALEKLLFLVSDWRVSEGTKGRDAEKEAVQIINDAGNRMFSADKSKSVEEIINVDVNNM